MPPTRTTRTSQSRTRATPSAGRQPEMRGQAAALPDQEVSQHEVESQVRSQQPPPPPVMDLVQVMNNQTLLLEALANAINRPRPRAQGMNEKLNDFLRAKPPTFAVMLTPWTQMIGCMSSKGRLSRLVVRTEIRFSWPPTSSLELP